MTTAISPSVKRAWSSVLANRYTLPALVGVVGLLVGIGLMAVVTPKPVNPATYTRPLQAQTTSLQAQTRYGRVFALNYTILDIHYNQFVTDVDASNTAAAEADAVRLATSTQTFINELKTLTVPACLRATNTVLLASLANIQQGASAVDKALVANDAGQASADVQQISQGLSQLTTAETDYAAATC